MTDDQITALAREFAEACQRDGRAILPPSLQKEDFIASCFERDRIVAREVIYFLLRRFYLADKEKAKAFYLGETLGVLDFIELVSSRRILSSLFPEIAKEVEG